MSPHTFERSQLSQQQQQQPKLLVMFESLRLDEFTAFTIYANAGLAAVALCAVCFLRRPCRSRVLGVQHRSLVPSSDEAPDPGPPDVRL